MHGRYVFGEQIESEENWFGAEEREKLKQLENSAEAAGLRRTETGEAGSEAAGIVSDSQPKKILRWVTALPLVDNASEK